MRPMRTIGMLIFVFATLSVSSMHADEQLNIDTSQTNAETGPKRVSHYQDLRAPVQKENSRIGTESPQQNSSVRPVKGSGENR